LDGLEAGSKAKHRIGAKIEPSGSFVVGEGQKGGPGKIQGGGTSFSGDAAEVSVWKRVLDRKEVLSMSKSNLGQGKSKAKGMVVLWDFKGATEDDGVVDRQAPTTKWHKEMTVKGLLTCTTWPPDDAERPGRVG
jgi:hypothetical protein